MPTKGKDTMHVYPPNQADLSCTGGVLLIVLLALVAFIALNALVALVALVVLVVLLVLVTLVVLVGAVATRGWSLSIWSSFAGCSTQGRGRGAL